jgi:TP901 family phage tail tape measure protein
VNVLQVAEATYEAISNQVVNGGNAVYFLAEALKFAETTVSTAAESVDLLTAGMNAYGLSTLHAADISASFYAIIEVGRVKASQMGNVMGTAANLAAQLGVNIDELGAGIAILTSQGTLPNTSLTLMSNIFLKLVKPSTEMTTLIKSWGVASGEAAIKTFGFAGVLQKLGQELEAGGLARIADLAKDIRAIRGISGLLNSNATGGFDATLDKIKASKEAFDSANEIIKDPQYYKYSQELQKIGNVLTTDFGRKAIEIFNEINSGLGGMANQTKMLADLTVAIIKPFSTFVSLFTPLANALIIADSRSSGWIRRTRWCNWSIWICWCWCCGSIWIFFSKFFF